MAAINVQARIITDTEEHNVDVELLRAEDVSENPSDSGKVMFNFNLGDNMFTAMFERVELVDSILFLEGEKSRNTEI